jgi:hypothetical protein
VDNQSARILIGEMSTIIKRINNTLSKAKKAVEGWDFKAFDKARDVFIEDTKLLAADSEDKLSQIDLNIQELSAFVTSPAYPEALEDELKAAGVPFRGAFPRYELIPYKLTIDVGQGVVILSVGRKSERISAFAPQQVAAWVAVRYKKLVERKFDSQQFCKELLDAYKIGNKIAYKNNEILWNHSVSLTTIYELLTLRRSAKQEYPKELYTYELGRLKEQFEIRYQNYRYEFGFARNQSNALLVTDSQGKESRLSSLMVYREDE